MSIRGNSGSPRGDGGAKTAPKEKKAPKQKWEAAPIAFPYDKMPEAHDFRQCCQYTADRMNEGVEDYNRHGAPVVWRFASWIYFTPPGTVGKKPCKYKLAVAQEQHFASMLLYHHCKQEFPSVVFRQKLAPGQVAEVTVVTELHATRAEDGQVQYEGTKLRGATAFKFTAPRALSGREIYARARLAMPEVDGEPFSLTAPLQRSQKHAPW